VPEEADCVLINAPQVDLSEDEAKLLSDYLERGGSLLVFSSYTVTDCPNLLEVLSDYGLEPEPGMILEGNASYCYRYRNYLLPAVEDTELTHAIYEAGYQVFAPNCHGVRATSAVRSTIVMTPLLTTSKDAYAKADVNNIGTGEKEDGDAAGPFNVGMAISEEHDDVTTQIVWVGCDAITDESADTLVSGTNSDLIMGALGWMCQRENSISIHAKSLTATRLTMDDAAANLWSLIFAVAIPVLLIAAGAVILMRRRKR